jgi:hypothetical protein
MSLSIEELVTIREAVNNILEELELDAYLFEVEPENAHYEVQLECASAINGGWMSVSLMLPKEKLLAGFKDEEIRNQLFEYWDKKLSACKRKTVQEKLPGKPQDEKKIKIEE